MIKLELTNNTANLTFGIFVGLSSTSAMFACPFYYYGKIRTYDQKSIIQITITETQIYRIPANWTNCQTQGQAKAKAKDQDWVVL